MPQRRGAEAARNELPQLLQCAEQGQTTLITRRGRPVAALVPIGQLHSGAPRQKLLTSLVGTGRGLWGPDSLATLQKLHDEWTR